jgi:hypothetical protein
MSIHSLTTTHSPGPPHNLSSVSPRLLRLPPFVSINPLQVLSNARENKFRNLRRHGIPDLLSNALSQEHMFVGKRLQAGYFSACQPSLAAGMTSTIWPCCCDAAWENGRGIPGQVAAMYARRDLMVGSVPRDRRQCTLRRSIWHESITTISRMGILWNWRHCFSWPITSLVGMSRKKAIVQY